MKWTQETMRFFADAAAQTDYYDEIAHRIVPMLPQDTHICDAGCGMGYLSLALLPHCAHVTAIDTSKEATDALREMAGETEKLTVRCGDIQELAPKKPYDAMVFCLFGDMTETLRIAAKQCRGRVFLIKRDYEQHRFSAGGLGLGVYTAKYSEQMLDEKHIPYTSERFGASFGQPFHSIEEAQRFFALYNRSESGSFSNDDIRAKLVKTDNPKFPLYLPNEKKLCLLTFDARDIREA